MAGLFPMACWWLFAAAYPIGHVIEKLSSPLGEPDR